jgi:hypothetical protein
MRFISESIARKEMGLSYIGDINSSAKLAKNKKVSGQYTYIIYLAPSNTSGFNVCKHSTKECRLGCLATSGRAGMEEKTGKDMIKNSRIKKTKLFIQHQEYFMRWVIAEMTRFQKKAERDGMGFSARLNGTSDIDYSKIYVDGKNIFEIFPDVQFYDYTKDASRMNHNIPNYQLTFSYTGRNTQKSVDVLAKGNNVAVVFDVKANKALPQQYMGYKVVDGDLTDFRPNDDKGIIIGLRFKEIGNKEISKQIKESVFVAKQTTL